MIIGNGPGWADVAGAQLEAVDAGHLRTNLEYQVRFLRSVAKYNTAQIEPLNSVMDRRIKRLIADSIQDLNAKAGAHLDTDALEEIIQQSTRMAVNGLNARKRDTEVVE